MGGGGWIGAVGGSSRIQARLGVPFSVCASLLPILPVTCLAVQVSRANRSETSLFSLFLFCVYFGGSV